LDEILNGAFGALERFRTIAPAAEQEVSIATVWAEHHGPAAGLNSQALSLTMPIGRAVLLSEWDNKEMRVVIVGGGFAAVKFAKTLRNKLRGSECEILLFNRENHMDGVPSPLGGCRWSFD
jgi:hypothetical protein